MFETPTNVPLGNVYTQSPYEVAIVIVTAFRLTAVTCPLPSWNPEGMVATPPGESVAPQLPRFGMRPSLMVLLPE